LARLGLLSALGRLELLDTARGRPAHRPVVRLLELIGVLEVLVPIVPVVVVLAVVPMVLVVVLVIVILVVVVVPRVPLVQGNRASYPAGDLPKGHRRVHEGASLGKDLAQGDENGDGGGRDPSKIHALATPSLARPRGAAPRIDQKASIRLTKGWSSGRVPHQEAARPDDHESIR
jgi:hypothetical protein